MSKKRRQPIRIKVDYCCRCVKSNSTVSVQHFLSCMCDLAIMVTGFESFDTVIDSWLDVLTNGTRISSVSA